MAGGLVTAALTAPNALAAADFPPGPSVAAYPPGPSVTGDPAPTHRRHHQPGCRRLFGLGELVMTGALPAMVNALAPAALRGRYNAALTLAMTSGMWAGPLLAAAATALDQLSLLFAAAVALLGVMAVLVQRPGRLAATPATNCERHNGRARRAVGLCCPPKRGV